MERFAKAAVRGSLSLFVLLAGCGGGSSAGGGSNPPPDNTPTVSLGTTGLTFAAPNPTAPTPAAQTLTATVTGTLSGTLYVVVKSTGPAVANISNVTLTGSNAGQASVTAALPSTLGAGSYTSTITVTTCVNDSTCATGQLKGSPATVQVTYNIGSSVQADVVAPRVVAANSTGAVIIRGHSLSATTNVTFGSQGAASFTVVSDSEIHATLPTLAAGAYPVSLNGGAIAYQATLTAVAASTLNAATLSFPAPPAGVQAIVFDAQRGALLVGVRQVQTGSNAVLRYALVNGAWQTPTAATIPLLRDLVLSPDGTEILAATDTGVTEFDPQTLVQGSSAALTMPSGVTVETLIGMVALNDGNALITANPGGPTPPLLYSSHLKTLSATALSGLNTANAGAPGASGDGSVAMIIQGDLTTPVAVMSYDASLGTFVSTTLQLLSNSNAVTGKPAIAPSLSNDGSKIALAGHPQAPPFFDCKIYDRKLKLLGSLPDLSWAVIVSPDGKRAYTVDPSGLLLTFDLTATPVSGAYPQVGAGVSIGTLGETESGRIKLAISPDGRTVFAAGAGGIAVVPTPP